MNNASQPTNLDSDANKDMDSQLKVIKLSVDMKIDLLSQMKLPIAKKSSLNANEVKQILENLITRKIKKVAEMTENEKISVTTILTRGRAILTEATKLQA